jgi:hypothetical protein
MPMLAMPETVLGKRSHRAEDSFGDLGIGGDNEHQSNYKKVKRVVEIGVLEAAGPATSLQPGPRSK